MDKYQPLDRELRRIGFFTNGVEVMGDWDRTTVCSKQLPGGVGYTGNSFWVTLLSDGWYVGTWGCLIYRISDASRVASFCVQWLSRHPDEILTDFDDDVKREFGLVPVTHEEFDAVAGTTVDRD